MSYKNSLKSWNTTLPLHIVQFWLTGLQKVNYTCHTQHSSGPSWVLAKSPITKWGPSRNIPRPSARCCWCAVRLRLQRNQLPPAWLDCPQDSQSLIHSYWSEGEKNTRNVAALDFWTLCLQVNKLRQVNKSKTTCKTKLVIPTLMDHFDNDTENI